MSLSNPTCKMSKSDRSQNSRILITDTADEIHRKISKAVTDSDRGISYSSERPGMMNLLHILMSVQDLQNTSSKKWESMDLAEMEQRVADEFSGLSSRDFKLLVAESLNDHLSPIREEYHRLGEDPAYVYSVLEEGEAKARAIAQETMKEVYKVVGL